MNAMSPQRLARVGGRLYLVVIAARVLIELVVRTKLIVPGDDVATALQTVMSATLFRFAIAGQLLMLACDAGMTVVLYRLLESVNRELAQVTAGLRFAGIAVSAGNAALLVAVPMLLLGHAPFLGTDLAQQQQAAMALLRLNSVGYEVSIVLLGSHLVLLGGLVGLSGYFPRALGVAVAIGGVGYVVGSVTRTMSPDLATTLLPGLAAPGLIGELVLAVWLVFVGVNIWRWHARSVSARQRRIAERVYA